MRRRRAEDSGRCDRNHIIERHTESCPSSPSQENLRCLGVKTKARFLMQGWGGVCLDAPPMPTTPPSMWRSLAPPSSASPTGETMAAGNGGAEFQVGVLLFPIPRYSRCRRCSCERLRLARLPLAVPLCRTCTPGPSPCLGVVRTKEFIPAALVEA